MPISVDKPCQHWTTLAKLPRLRQEHSTVSVDDNTIAVIGGATPIGNASLFTVFTTVDWPHLYDIPPNSWRTGAPSPYRVNHPNVATKNGSIYLLGGLVDASDPPKPLPEWVASGESHVYDSQTDTWTQLESMPPGTERGSAILGVHHELIYVAGGMTILDGAYQDAVTTVTAFNTTSGKWERLVDVAANIPEGRQHAAGAIVDETLYITGGRWFEKTNVRDDVFMLDLNNLTAGWKTGKTHMPTARGGISGAAVGAKLYTFGGETNQHAATGVFDNVEVFDKWEELTPMQVPRHGTSAATVGNKIYIPGGGLQQDGLMIMVDGVGHFLNTTDHFEVLTL
ncbi:uncharacterized protein NECHADRAFT_45187 [Fusarium vanettenii 77-13-4]|uniref:Galactose oxidase n=1 Tax=Fusarium vanettenii (strain ATCC MYA-4622 / CBS 123669 / FGSC 9596 / NRRL 45880 / 77-13-4) TaxID=660122 RepID=C7YX66_FUSV7|nr:uncharacterized protein NECHADRAFT_45187 [Fusarium vanettenii 77-13-4]EEU43530.1 hypothetical protein NECHADRAFT_45187 [Fusarium vanettenii 77-13-4]